MFAGLPFQLNEISGFGAVLGCGANAGDDDPMDAFDAETGNGVAGRQKNPGRGDQVGGSLGGHGVILAWGRHLATGDNAPLSPVAAGQPALIPSSGADGPYRESARYLPLEGAPAVGDVIELGPQRPPDASLPALAADFLAAVDLSDNTRRAYGASLEALVDDVGERSLDSIGRATIERHLRERYSGRSPATVNRHLAAISGMFSWAAEIGIITASPAAGIRRRRQPRSREAERQARPIPLDELQSLWDSRKGLTRDRVLWRLLYDSGARASEVLGLNIEDLDLAGKRATVIGKGGDAETIMWSTETARVLPAVLRWHHLRREAGPVFVSWRRLRYSAGVPARDLCPLTGYNRLSYNRASAVFKEASGGRTLHQLRHSRLTHLAESGVDVTILRAVSRHSSLRTLDRYVNPSSAAISAALDEHPPGG